MTGPTIGTHNLHDDAGRVTLFADAIGYTEALPRNVRAKVRTAAARSRARLTGYRVRVCTHQKDLVFACRRRVWQITATHYEPVHEGEKEVTPHRGTFVIETVRRATGAREVFLLPHRINAAFPPWVRGEAHFRANMWHRHAAADARLIADYRARGFVVHAFGDTNTPKSVRGFRTLPHEIGHGFDRIASTLPLTEVRYLHRAGSDHPRLRARLAR